ncbi:hypothetical protein HOD08_03870 [bacterium]|nr:hypothetical protein [bacterium]
MPKKAVLTHVKNRIRLFGLCLAIFLTIPFSSSADGFQDLTISLPSPDSSVGCISPTTNRWLSYRDQWLEDNFVTFLINCRSALLEVMYRKSSVDKSILIRNLIAAYSQLNAFIGMNRNSYDFDLLADVCIEMQRRDPDGFFKCLRGTKGVFSECKEVRMDETFWSYVAGKIRRDKIALRPILSTFDFRFLRSVDVVGCDKEKIISASKKFFCFLNSFNRLEHKLIIDVAAMASASRGDLSENEMVEKIAILYSGASSLTYSQNADTYKDPIYVLAGIRCSEKTGRLIAFALKGFCTVYRNDDGTVRVFIAKAGWSRLFDTICLNKGTVPRQARACSTQPVFATWATDGLACGSTHVGLARAY